MEKERELQEKIKKLEEVIYETQLALNELTFALSGITDYDTCFKLNSSDLYDYMHGNEKNERGRLSFDFLYNHDRIMWMARVATVFCERAQELCKSADE